MLHSGEERWADNEFAPPAPDLYWERQAPGLFLKRQSLPWVTAPAQTRLSPCGRSIIITENKPERAKETERNQESSVPEAEPGTVLWGMMNYQYGRMRLPHTSMNTGLLPLTHSNGLLPLSTPSYWGELTRFRTTRTQGSLQKRKRLNVYV